MSEQAIIIQVKITLISHVLLCYSTVFVVRSPSRHQRQVDLVIRPVLEHHHNIIHSHLISITIVKDDLNGIPQRSEKLALFLIFSVK